MYIQIFVIINLCIIFTTQRSIHLQEGQSSDLTEDEINKLNGFEGKEDLIFYEEPNKNNDQGQQAVKSRHRRGIAKTTMWPKTSDGELIIPYVFDDSMTNPFHRERIEKFINLMNNVIRCNQNTWRPRTNEEFYVNFTLSNGCSSWIGRIPSFYQPQGIWLSEGCIEWNEGSVLHEMMHAMGFFHEQSRSDRDSYVKINWDNIITDAKDNFEKEDTISLGSPYDYGSVMHYSPFIFNIDGKPTMTKLDTSSTEKMGQRQQLSASDIEQINMLYGCPITKAVETTTTKPTTSSTTTTTTEPTTSTSTSTVTTTTKPTTSISTSTMTTKPTTSSTTTTTTEPTTSTSTSISTVTKTTRPTTSTSTSTTITKPTTSSTTTTTTKLTTSTSTVIATTKPTTSTSTTTTTNKPTTSTSTSTTTTKPTTSRSTVIVTTKPTTSTSNTTTTNKPTTSTSTSTTTTKPTTSRSTSTITTTPRPSTSTSTSTTTTTTTTANKPTTSTSTSTTEAPSTQCPEELCSQPSEYYVFSLANPKNPQQFITCYHFWGFKFSLGCQFCPVGFIFHNDIHACVTA